MRLGFLEGQGNCLTDFAINPSSEIKRPEENPPAREAQV
jgi:hypothetical protein